MGRGLILLVDDDDDFRDALAEVLTDEGFAVARTRNGLEALDWLRRGGRPDVILLDLMMPVMDGYQFRERQLRDPSLAAIPVVAFSAGAHADRSRSLQAECLEKPFDIECLLEAIRRRVAPAAGVPPAQAPLPGSPGD